MSFFLILPHYIIWHYSQGLIDLKNIWRNFIVFFYEFFSIPTLILTLFSPWRRIQDTHAHDFSFDGIAGAIVVNTLMRIVGAVVRLVFIVLGIICVICTAVSGLAVLLVWITMPFVLIYTITTGLSLLIS